VGVVCLESIWRTRLTRDCCWSSAAVERLVYCLAPSTMHSYNRLVNRFHTFCQNQDIDFPPSSTGAVADFLCKVANGSERPNSVLRTASAAIGHVYKGHGIANVVERPEIQLLITGLVKSGTAIPMKRSKVMPIQNFHDLFLGWPENGDLSTKDLRLKTICLLALTLMLRPSDAAPKGAFHTENGPTGLVFTVDQVQFTDSGAKFTFFGIKNDTSRTGFEVTIPNGSVRKIDPIQTLRDYLARTECFRLPHGPVFIGLKAPYGALGAASIARILDESISVAGLSGQGFTAKSFRPTGATSAIECKVDPDIVRKIGRWKNSEVFYQHYVHARTPSEYTDVVLNHI